MSEEDYRQALRLDPDNPAALLELALLLRDKGECQEEAESLLRRLSERLPDAGAPLVLLGGLIHLQGGRVEEAAELYRRAVEVDPQCHSGWMALGVYYRLEVDQSGEEALACFRRASEIDPQRAEAWLNLGQTLLPVRSAEAIAPFRTAVKLDPANGEAWFGLGAALELGGESLDEAVQCLQTAVELRPNEGQWWDHLGCLWLDQRNRPVEARSAFERAIHCPDSDPAYARANLFWALALTGEVEQARALRPQLSGLEQIGYDLCDAALKLLEGGVRPSLEDLASRVDGDYQVDWERLQRLAGR